MEFGDNLSNLQNMVVLVGDSAEDLLAQIKLFNLPTKPISIYGMNGRHYGWFLSQNKIVKVDSKKELKKKKE